MGSDKATKRSGKQIQEIWTEAFVTNKAVKLRGKMVSKRFTRAWFECVDGRTYQLTQQELKEYKPDVWIHKSFKTDCS
jgi:hypothetical protein